MSSLFNIDQIIDVTFSTATAEQRMQVRNFLLDPANNIEGKSYANYLESLLWRTETTALLPEGIRYVFYSGPDASKKAGAYIEAYKKAGIIGDTPYGKLVEGFEYNDTVLEYAGKFEAFLNERGIPTYSTEIGRGLNALSDVAWNAGSAEFARNALAIGLPTVAFITEGASISRAYGALEVPVLMEAPLGHIHMGMRIEDYLKNTWGFFEKVIENNRKVESFVYRLASQLNANNPGSSKHS